MKKHERTVFYTDDITDLDLQEAKEQIVNDEFGYSEVGEVPDGLAYQFARDNKDFDFEELRDDLARYIKQNDLIVFGTCGRWDGRVSAGAFVRDIADLWKGLRHCDYLEVYEEDGHFYIKGVHHDWTDLYEVKRLTQKGVDLAYSHGWDHDQDLHNTIAKCNLYSGLPYFGRFCWGC